ncbi:MAG: hypothetical protein NTZ55_05910 [Candidatus Roizmanbacteria bacterium]|nr:hypothetical protein [Candidatus Roizmanbacteria bacterium]
MIRKGSGILVGAIIAVVVLGLLGYFGSFLVRTAPSTKLVPTPAVNIGDIDRSGFADETDRTMVRSHIGCTNSQPCWNTTIGKTKDGDNPLYVFDLDLNKDRSITQADIDMVK